MCDATLISAGLKAGEAVMDYNAEVEASNARNQNAANNIALANQAANNKYNARGERLIEDNATLVQEGFDAALEGRASRATAMAMATTVQGISVDETMFDILGQAGRNKTRIGNEISGNVRAAEADFINISDERAGRVASMPYTAPPSKAGLLIGMGGAGVDASDSPEFNKTEVT